MGWEDVINKDLKEMGTSWEGNLEEERGRLCWPQAAWCFSELLLLVVVVVFTCGESKSKHVSIQTRQKLNEKKSFSTESKEQL